MFDMLYTLNMNYPDNNRKLSANNVISSAYGLGEMINLAPAAGTVDYNNRRAEKKHVFGRRPAKPIYQDHSMYVGR
jgi:hypothetical protein